MLYQTFKRLIDIAGSCVGLCITLFLALPIALAVKLDSKGPVLFVQTRITRNGRTFRFYKFRTMFIDMTFSQGQLDQLNEATGPIFKIRDDPRITRVGRFLRRYSLDELPQFYNVLQGRMSLVGPRPPLVHEVEKYTLEQKRRLSVKQGMTGLWQVSGRSKLTFEKMVDLDLYYVDHCSLGLDLKILWNTLYAVTRAVGSY